MMGFRRNRIRCESSVRSISRILIVIASLSITSMLSADALSVIPNTFRNSVAATGLHPAFASPAISSRSMHAPCLRLSSDETDNLLEKASRLRKEAELLEITMQGTREVAKEKRATEEQGKAKKTCTSFKNSTWLISYRFASDAVKQDDDDDDDEEVKLIYYSGKVEIKLTEDGYTNVHSDNSKEGSSSGVRFEKFWGWDEETSQEDDLQYVLFSADVLLPEADPNNEKKPIRYYFQAQVDTDAKSNEITLSGGTVTLKKDIKPPGGFWGAFNGGGILAQFRYCGEFLMKPC